MIQNRGNDLETLLNEIKALDQRYFMNTFGNRTPLLFDHGEGSWLIDHEGNRYLDMLGGIAVNVLGHGNKALTTAIIEQASKVLHVSNLYYIESQSRLAERLCQMTDMDKVFFSNSGAEANEAAIKLVRAYFNKRGESRPRILTAEGSFHGRTLATAAATGQPKYNLPFRPLPPGFETVKFNDIDDLKMKMGTDVGAIMLEMVQGESGVYPLAPDYVRAVIEFCQTYGSLLIIDEIQTGMGRCGSFTASAHYGIRPDIITLAKGLGGGLPIGAVLATNQVSSAFEVGDHGSTFGGNPLVCAAALAVLDEYQRLNLCSGAKIKGQDLMEGLRTLAGITAVRGIGLMLGFDVTKSSAIQYKERLRSQGILVGSVGEKSIRLLPPLTIEDAEISHFLSVLKAIDQEL